MTLHFHISVLLFVWQYTEYITYTLWNCWISFVIVEFPVEWICIARLLSLGDLLSTVVCIIFISVRKTRKLSRLRNYNKKDGRRKRNSESETRKKIYSVVFYKVSPNHPLWNKQEPLGQYFPRWHNSLIRKSR